MPSTISPCEVATANVLLQGCVAPYSQSTGRSIPKDESLNGNLRPGTVEDHVRSSAADVAKVLVSTSQISLSVQKDGRVVLRLFDAEWAEGDVGLQGGLGGLDGRLELGIGFDKYAAPLND